MRLYEREWTIPLAVGNRGLLAHFAQTASQQLAECEQPVRFVVSRTGQNAYHAEVGILEASPHENAPDVPSIFEFRKRAFENTQNFNVVLLVPTGMNATIGGHAGDACPVARLLASTCDTLVTHPNVVNGSDINEQPENSLYVEGSVICRLLMGTVGLQRTRANRVLLVIDKHEEVAYSNAAINAANAARACYGFDCPRVVMLDPPVKLVSEYSSSGRATGKVDNLSGFIRAIEPYAKEFDALAVSSVIEVPPEFHQDYFDSEGEMVNPWGGVEAIFTHALSLLLGIPSAHSPMIESEEVEAIDPGIVDPRMAAEAVSLTFLQSILKGLMRSPRLVTDRQAMEHPAILSARDVSCLVIPDGCLGLPVLAALEQGIPVIAVRDPSTLMRNDISALPWAPGQFRVVNNYLEAAGVLCARRAGLALESLERPILPANITEVTPPTNGKAHRAGRKLSVKRNGATPPSTVRAGRGNSVK